MPLLAQVDWLWTLGAPMAVYLVVLFGIAFWARSRIRTDEDFLVAGRRLPFLLSTATLFATWFGAGTLLASADEVRDEGLRVTCMEPYGAGIALILAGVFFARRLWDEKILTVNDAHRRFFGRRAELVSTFVVLSYPGWIATQLIGMAGILHVFFDLPLVYGILLVAVVSMLYTLIGGMWSVTITDAAQVLLLLAGLLLLGWNVFGALTDGGLVDGVRWTLESSSPSHMTFVPLESLHEFTGWLGLFIAGTVGLVPGQDLMQRVFSSKSSRVAVRACIAAGILYIGFGTIPVLLGLVAKLVGDEEADRVIPYLARRFLSPELAVLFVLSLMSTIMSTIDSALLAPSSILAQNLFRPLLGERVSTTRLTHFSIVGITVVSVVFALLGEDAFALLNHSYSLGIAPLVVLAFGVYQKKRHELAAVVALSTGLGLWVAELVWDYGLRGALELDLPELPFPVIVLVLSLASYCVMDTFLRRRTQGTRP